uniref:Uncharacterized protein n=1 Tax=Rhizophora mucronata TaxID=61149 RepID=A0A2P2NND9_RHIMU
MESMVFVLILTENLYQSSDLFWLSDCQSLIIDDDSTLTCENDPMSPGNKFCL